MPELPEVETVRRQLESLIVGKSISSVRMDAWRYYDEEVRDQRASIVSVRRRAKLLIIDFSNGNSLLVHLKMTGALLYGDKDKLPTHTHPRIWFEFADGSELLFADVRRFGYVRLVATDKIEEWLGQTYRPGVEPFSKEFTATKFKELMGKKSRSPIKNALLDQHLIAGIGNIYAQEACWYAKVHPTRLCSTLTDSEMSLLHKHVVAVMKKSLKTGGTSANDYVDVSGKKGGFLSLLKVYGKNFCPTCKNDLDKIKMAGRGTWYCGKCQV